MGGAEWRSEGFDEDVMGRNCKRGSGGWGGGLS